MRPESATAKLALANGWPRLVLAVWVLLLAGIGLRVGLKFSNGGVFPLYANAARSWLAGEDPYHAKGNEEDAFRYSPTATLLLVPFASCPHPWGAILWQGLNFAAFLGGFAWWYWEVVPDGRLLSPKQSAALWLLLIPLAVSSLSNGQFNPLTLGLLLAGVAAAARERWSLSAIALALAGVIKVYPLAVGLLVVLLFPRKMALRFLGAVTVCLAVPFFCQRFEYVMGEYCIWLEVLTGDKRVATPSFAGNRDLLLLFSLARVPITAFAYHVLQLALAGGVAGLCLAARALAFPRRKLLFLLTVQALCWMVLCGPASEWSTYILLAPVLSWAVVDAWQSRRSRGRRAAAAAIAATFLVHPLLRIFPDGATWFWQFIPASALLLWAYVLLIQLQEVWEASKAVCSTRGTVTTSCQLVD